MIAFVRKNVSTLISKQISPVVHRFRSPASFSFSFHYFSTSTESELGISARVFDILVHKYEFPPELASRVASELSHLNTPEKPDSILSFFKASGFSNNQVEKIVKFKPRLLSASLEGSIKPKIKILQDEGFSSDEITKLIASSPKTLLLSVKNNIIPSLSVLKGLLGATSTNNEVARVISNHPRFLSANFENTVLPNVDFLKSCGVSMERIRIILTYYPGCFVMKPETLRRCADKAKEMGLDASSKSFIYAIPTIAKMSIEAWDLKMQALGDLGFSDSDVLTMFRKYPQVLYRSIEKINKVKELLLATGKYNVSDMVNCPRSFIASIEKRYIPRLRVLGILESRELVKEWPALGTICALSDVKFSNRFIRPYLDEVGDVYSSKISASGKKG